MRQLGNRAAAALSVQPVRQAWALAASFVIHVLSLMVFVLLRPPALADDPAQDDVVEMIFQVPAPVAPGTQPNTPGIPEPAVAADPATEPLPMAPDQTPVLPLPPDLPNEEMQPRILNPVMPAAPPTPAQPEVPVPDIPLPPAPSQPPPVIPPATPRPALPRTAPRPRLPAPPRPAVSRQQDAALLGTATQAPVVIPVPGLPGPAPSAPVAPAASQVSSGWRNALAAWLQSRRSYPESARRRSEEGTAVLRFTVTRDGQVIAVTLVTSSGSPTRDDAALAMLRGARLPAFTADMTQAQTTVTVPIRCRLEQ